MTMVFSKKVRELMDEVSPYIDNMGDLMPGAPNYIKEKHSRLLKLMDEEMAE